MTALVAKHLPLIAGAPDGIKRLRGLILDLAIQGKLVEQVASEEPSSKLLAKIDSMKGAFLRKAELARFNALAVDTKDICKFALPTAWSWRRLGALGLVGSSSRVHQKDWQAAGVPFYRTREIVQLARHGSVDPDLFISEDLYRDLTTTGPVPTGGDIMITGVGTIGVPYVVAESDRFYFKDASVLIFKNYFCLNPDYLALVFGSPYWHQLIHQESMGTTVHTLTIGRAGAIPIPVPPLAEQHRIVAKVDELMALCDRLEADQADAEAAHAQLVQALLDSLTQATDFRASWQRLSEHFHTLFTTEASIDALKQTVLQVAVMGRLVPQIKRDGSAVDLLASIATMGKSKALVTPDVDENLPAVPPSWCWIRIAHLAHVGTGATPSRTNPAYFDPPEISWVTSGETSQAFVRSTEQKVSPLALNETNLTVYPVGTLVVAMYGQGKTRGQVTELLIEACTNQACAAIQLICDDSAHRKFVKYFFEKSYDELRSLAAGGAQPNLNLGKIKETLIPLPPLAEQHRIVAKVDDLMALCDQLKAQLAEARQQHAQLATVLVEQAVA